MRQGMSKTWDAGKRSPGHPRGPGHGHSAGVHGKKTVNYPKKDREAFREALVNIIM